MWAQHEHQLSEMHNSAKCYRNKSVKHYKETNGCKVHEAHNFKEKSHILFSMKTENSSKTVKGERTVKAACTAQQDDRN
jgi:hypothetical protein